MIVCIQTILLLFCSRVLCITEVIIFLIVVKWLDYFFLSVSNFLSNRSSTATKLVCCQGWTSQMLPGPPWQLRGCKKKCGGAHAQNTPSHPHFHIQDLVSQRNWGHKTCTKNMHYISMQECVYCRPVVPGCAGCAMAHPEFGRSVNPISTRGDRLCPPNYYWHTRIFRTSDGPVVCILLIYENQNSRGTKTVQNAFIKTGITLV